MKDGAKLDSELNLIRHVTRLAGAARGAGVMAGIGDDCAIFRPRAGEDLLFTTDLLIEDVHFTRTAQAAAVGHKALARGLSDIAAMGGSPRFCLLSLALAPWVDSRWVGGFYRGLLALGRRFNATLAGGDLSHAEKVACDIVVCGAVPRGKALRRNGARVGDFIHVTGPLGKPWQKHPRPEPRIAMGIALRSRATAAMDLSDGLSIDLHRLCEASGVAAELDRVPLVGGSSLDQALHGGEDYELLFTLPARRRAPAGCHRIGRIVEGVPGTVSMKGRVVPPLGYDHFRSRA